MSYCTATDLADDFGSADIIALTNPDSVDATSVNEAAAARAIAKAGVEIDSYIGGRYPLPLPTVPVLLRYLASDLARYYLHTRIDDDHPVAQRYKQRIKQLENISRGTQTLGLDAASAPAAPADTVQVSTGRNDFGDRDSW